MQDRNSPLSTDTLASFGRRLLENNVFEFNGKVYKQVLGTAIGTTFAPVYANLFMVSL